MTTNSAPIYAKGDWIVHSYHGVGQIEGRENISIGEGDNTYFRVKTKDSTIWIPVEQIDEDQIRPVTDRLHLEEAIEVLNKPPKEMSSNLNSRKSRIKQVYDSNDLVENARLIRDLHARRRSKGVLNWTERQALKELTKHFVHEWSVSIGLATKEAQYRLNRELRRIRKATHKNTIQVGDHPGDHRRKGDESSLFSALLKQDNHLSKWFAQQLKKEV